MNIGERALKLHEQSKGKIRVVSSVPLSNRDDLSLAYTPGVAEPCKEIHKNPDDVYKYTSKGNLVAVVTDGTAVLGLGNIGSKAAIPVMEGKSILFKNFADIDAFPICLDTDDIDEIVKTVKYLAPVFGGINIEDIAAPRCFEIERRLKEVLDIPVFHDDQHGTAIVVLSGLINALKLVNKKLENITVVINGAGSAGTAIGKLLLNAGLKDLIMVDRSGAIFDGMQGLSPAHSELAKITNPHKKQGGLADVMADADVFIGVSAPNIVSKQMVASMNKDSIVFAMANPTPEIMPDLAKEAGARVVGTGRSDFPNQVNNVLAFPGIFRGALDVRAKDINEEMKLAAAYAIAGLIDEKDITDENIIPSPFNPNVAKAVADAVKAAARKTGVARIYSQLTFKGEQKVLK